jgi:tripartite-type tricarboxylate transporter receptor subunit TctC
LHARIAPSRRRLVLAAAGLALAGGAPAQQDYPQRPITLIVPFAAGGIADLTARTIARAMAQSLGQTLIIDNRPSAGTIVGSAAVAQAAPDGYTLLLLSNANAISASLFKALPFDTLRAFAPISTVGSFDLALFVGAGSRFTSLRELIGHARTQPGKLSIGTITPGSTQHLAAALFKSTVGIDGLIVPYKASPALLTALRGGEIDVAFEFLAPMLPQVAAAAVRALAVTAAQRHPALPEVPTVQESGVRDYAVASWNALAAPAGTAAAIVARLNRAVREALADRETAGRLAGLGVRAQASSPAQLQVLLESEITRWGAVIRQAKIEPQ